MQAIIRCPYCGHFNRVKVYEVNDGAMLPVECDGETGGCARGFVFVPHIVVGGDTYKLVRNEEQSHEDH